MSRPPSLLVCWLSTAISVFLRFRVRRLFYTECPIMQVADLLSIKETVCSGSETVSTHDQLRRHSQAPRDRAPSTPAIVGKRRVASEHPSVSSENPCVDARAVQSKNTINRSVTLFAQPAKQRCVICSNPQTLNFSRGHASWGKRLTGSRVLSVEKCPPKSLSTEGGSLRFPRLTPLRSCH